MSPKYVLRGTRLTAAATIVVDAWFAVDEGLRPVNLVLWTVVLGTWALVELVAAEFEEIRQRTQARYDQLLADAPSACEVAARTILAMDREQGGGGGEVLRLQR